ncbi:uncharacterized protein YdaT [Salsuginibacillus halophilus]|uniref:Uncharacterized protein YdaT n=1 Tax=Salsuginibacillus halophilus TaxID=517424 RepID=A0A2P8H3S1_9BACI|nr:DUF2188 domain-containing protein [Salsuginibacillus halophilus]PSL40862.1 uncharacterized protein YdaT [Salsuginibacillus halophilus]
MPWDQHNYPSAFKNLETAVRKKAIDIANAMLDEGYEEDEAIPIAIEQGKEWYRNADQQEVSNVKQMTSNDLQTRDRKSHSSRPELMEKGEHVLPHEDGWAVQAQGAEKPAEVYEDKSEAIKRAREIAYKKETHLVVHQRDGSIQEKTSYDFND